PNQREVARRGEDTGARRLARGWRPPRTLRGKKRSP
ncbi:hypothetical protein AK812_SmicGene46368, partial [Symbiodinium microadriaticum]